MVAGGRWAPEARMPPQGWLPATQGWGPHFPGGIVLQIQYESPLPPSPPGVPGLHQVLKFKTFGSPDLRQAGACPNLPKMLKNNAKST